MRAVLGIDAAWTATQPSGVALVVETPNGWLLKAAEASYQRFQSLADNNLRAEHRPSGSRPDAHALLASASVLCGGRVDLVAIDMPLAHKPIVARRVSDNAISKAYGGRNCSTHTPNPSRPGRISDDMRQGFAQEGYPLQTAVVTPPGLIEVYPHPALVELANASNRLPYKASKVRSYWRSAAPIERRALLYRQWTEIVTRLENEIAGVAKILGTLGIDASGWQVKAYEDILDAIICAWVAVCALEKRVQPFGDENSAIWVPSPRTSHHMTL
jgi:predicted RNase H-like nuclease